MILSPFSFQDLPAGWRLGNSRPGHVSQHVEILVPYIEFAIGKNSHMQDELLACRRSTKTQGRRGTPPGGCCSSSGEKLGRPSTPGQPRVWPRSPPRPEPTMRSFCSQSALVGLGSISPSRNRPVMPFLDCHGVLLGVSFDMAVTAVYRAFRSGHHCCSGYSRSRYRAGRC